MADLENESAHFLTSFNGQIERIGFEGGICSQDEIFLRYDIVHGDQWQLVTGYNGGITQTSVVSANNDDFVFNMPLNVTFRSTTPYGWPQLIISVYGISPWGVEAIKGYGRCFFPATTDQTSFQIPLFAPRPMNMWAEFMSWLTGKNPELIDPTILASGNDSYLLRTRSYGFISLKLNMMTKGLRSSGFDNISTQQSTLVHS